MVLNVQEYGVVEDEQVFVHVESEVSLYWYWAEATPTPAPSLSVEVSVTEPERLAASAPIVAVGAVLSILREVTAADVPLLLTPSIATARKS